VGRNSLVHASWLLAGTSKLTIATGIANIWGRDAQSCAAARSTLNEQSGGRFKLGLGVSHQPIVQKLRGHNYDKPLQFMREYLEGMARAMYRSPAPQSNNELILAALRPGMLKLSAELADGAHPYNVTPEHTRRAREVIGPGKKLYVEQKVCLSTDASRVRKMAAAYLKVYIRLPNYRNNWLWLGFTEADMDGPSDRFLDAMVAWGDASAIRARIDEHLAAGADQVCIQALDPEGGELADWKALERLAPNK
jgi:probable F420-dependent oxidoreductase